MMRALQRMWNLRQRRLPVFVAASEQDATLNSRATLDWFARLQGPRRMLYYTRGRPAVPDFVKCIDARIPRHGIRSFAHTAMIQSPDNPHYGSTGRYRACSHYHHLDPDKYHRCMRGGADCLGEIFRGGHDCEVLQRVTLRPMPRCW